VRLSKVRLFHDRRVQEERVPLLWRRASPLTTYNNRWALVFRGILIERFGGKCEACGETFSLEFAHVKETPLPIKTRDKTGRDRGRGRKERLSDVSLRSDCFILACRSCHDILTALEKMNGGLLGSREAALTAIKGELQVAKAHSQN